tara:strand:- start:3023 stop:4747 length:1725 start_codon:yes stop_codon:yes gene_type:complete
MTKKKRNKKININQKSFYFEDYLATNQFSKKKEESKVSEDRIFILFFSFICLITAFLIKISTLSFQDPIFSLKDDYNNYFSPIRRDIVDTNGELISRNVKSHHAAVRSKMIKDKKKFALKIKYIYPDMNINQLLKNLNEKKYFYIKKRLTNDEKVRLWKLGEKGIVFEPFQTRIYPHSKLYSHILGQIDSENYGISGIEKFLDKDLKNAEKLNIPLKLSLDTNLQFVIHKELNNSVDLFNTQGSASLLMKARTGEILSLVSLPDYNINKRENISSSKFINKITMGVYELGSIFKTFTIALAIDKKIIDSNTLIKNIPNKVNCSKYTISDIKDFPEELTTSDILIRSSNIGSLMIARKIGKEQFKSFLNKIHLLEKPKLEIDEIGTPLNFKWNKCKLETVSYGHGITTTPLQAASAYASILNGGMLIQPTLLKKDNIVKHERIIKESTSKEMQGILRKVVEGKNGTAHLADIQGYNVMGKTGTAENYIDKKKNINTFVSSFSANGEKYILLILLEDPQVAKDLVYDYRGQKIKGFRNEAGWNSVYVAGQIIKKIGPILAINNKEFNETHVVEKIN